VWLDFDEFLAPPSEGASLTDRTVLPMMLEGQILVHPHVAIDFSLPWAGYLSSGSGVLVLGDFTFGVHAVGAFFSGPDAALAFSSGLSVALPALPPVGPTGSNFGGYLGAQDTLVLETIAFDRYFGELSLSLPFELEGWRTHWFRYRFGFGPGISFGPAPSPLYGIQSSLGLEVRFPYFLVAGVDGHFTALWAASSPGLLLAGGGPYVGYDPPSGHFFARIALLAGLAESTLFEALLTQVGYKF